MAITAGVVVGGGALLGGLAGSQGKSSTQTSNSAPWDAQQPYLKDIFGQAQNTFNARNAQPFYTGDLYAKLNGTQTDALNSGVNFAGTTGAQLADGVTGVANGALGSAGTYSNNASGLFARASTDPTKANIADAGQYANNPYVNGMVDAATRDVSRTLNEDTLPQNNLDAAGTGNMNSSRAGVIDAQAQRAAGDRVADISSQIRGGLYNDGLGLAQGARESGLSAGLSANGQLGDTAKLGLDAAQLGTSLAYGNTDKALAYGGVTQADQQAQDDAAFQRYQGNDQRTQSLLQQYMGLVQGNYGGTSTTTATSGGGIGGAIQGALGGAAMGGGLYSMYGGGAGATPLGPVGYPQYGLPFMRGSA